MADKAALKRSILDAGVAMWPDVTARSIARQIGTSHTIVLYHFRDIVGLKAAIAEHAVLTCDSRVIAQLIATKHPAVDSMPAETIARYMGLAAAR
jgi:AcrR family transcriptional regulator